MLVASSRLPLFFVADTAAVAWVATSIAAAVVLLDDCAAVPQLTFPRDLAAVAEPGMMDGLIDGLID
jgi:hypothetical protein